MALPAWIGSLALLAAAHTGAWAAGRLLGPRFAAPIDAGVMLADGQRLLGDHKTWRGVVAGVLACTLLAPLLGYPLQIAVAFAILALTADAVSSFVKRRLRCAPGTEIPGLDQLPEALLPLLVLSRPLGIGLADVGILTAVFVLLDLAAMRLRHHTRGTGGPRSDA